MVPRQIFRDHGLLDEAMELGADDLELSWRLRALGYSLAIAGDVFVHHKGSVSFSTLTKDEWEYRVNLSDQALVAKLKAVYGERFLLSSQQLWGCDVFSAALLNDRESAGEAEVA